MNIQHAPTHRPARQSGYTLVELMVSIVIGLVILLALGTIYLATSRSTSQSSAVTRMSEDAALAFNLVGSDLRMAGYSRPRVLALPASAIENGIEQLGVDRNFTGAAIRGCDHGFTSASLKGKFEDLACDADTSKPAAIALRFEGDETNTVPIGGLPSDCVNAAVSKTPNPVHPGSAIDGQNYYLVESRYFIKTDGASATPELSCFGNGGTANPGDPPASPQPLVQFVEDVQLRYGVGASTGDRDVKFYATSAQVDALPGADVDTRWSRVINLRVCMVLRGDRRDQAGSGYYLDCDGNRVSAPDEYPRRAFTSFYTLRNRGDFLIP